MYETERLILRAFDTEHDFDYWWRGCNSYEFLSSLTRSPFNPTSQSEAKEMLKENMGKSKLPKFAICLKPTPDATGNVYTHGVEGLPPLIGSVSLMENHSFDFKNRVAKLGIGILDPAHRNKGYGSEAITFVLEYAFMHLGLHRVELDVYSFNEMAIASYKKIGFVHEGQRRKHYFKEGQWHDTVGMGILEEEWFERRKTIKKLPRLSKTTGTSVCTG